MARKKENPWAWTKQRETAARRVAEDSISDRAIAEEIGVAQHTIYIWRQRPEFMARVDQYVNEYRARIRRSGLAVVENRVRKLEKVARYMEELMEKRLADHGSPIIVRQVKGIGSGDSFREVEEFPTDTGLLREYREYLKQVPQDLGQWQEKAESAGDDRLGELIDIVKRGAVEPAKPTAESEEKQNVPD